MTPLVAFKESNHPQGRFAFADGKLQSGDKSCQARKFMAFDQLSARPPRLFRLGTSLRRA